MFLPALVDTDSISAAYISGLLQVRLAKLPLDKARKILITDG